MQVPLFFRSPVLSDRLQNVKRTNKHIYSSPNEQPFVENLQPNGGDPREVVGSGLSPDLCKWEADVLIVSVVLKGKETALEF